MSTPDKISNTKLNKHYDLSTIKSELFVFIKEFFTVNFFAVNNRNELINTLFQQVNDNRSKILVRNEYFQKNTGILPLMEYISENEKVESRRALRRSFKHDLSDRSHYRLF
jgi:hypothetical protein